MDLELHIFTNSTVHAPSTKHIEETYQSFLTTFQIQIEPTIWCDPNPNLKKSDKYIRNLKKKFRNVVQTKSLSDGYIQAIEKSNAQFLLMLEHDWAFLNIPNSIEEILMVMERMEIMHLRFNKRDNKVENTDLYLEEVKTELFDYCLTPSVSNNPHILNRKIYIERALKKINLTSGSLGIEEVLTAAPEIVGYIYGGIDFPQTIEHTDGRNLNARSTIFQILDYMKRKNTPLIKLIKKAIN